MNNLPKDGITFEGTSVEELKAAGKAQARGESLNDFVTKAIEDEIEAEAQA